jgi:hypothetical protein
MNAQAQIINSFEKEGKKFLHVEIEIADGEDTLTHNAVEDLIQQFKSGTLPFIIRDDAFSKLIKWKEISGKYIDGVREGNNLVATIEVNQDSPEGDTFFDFVKNGMPLFVSLNIEKGEYSEEEI